MCSNMFRKPPFLVEADPTGLADPWFYPRVAVQMIPESTWPIEHGTTLVATKYTLFLMDFLHMLLEVTLTDKLLSTFL